VNCACKPQHCNQSQLVTFKTLLNIHNQIDASSVNLQSRIRYRTIHMEPKLPGCHLMGKGPTQTTNRPQLMETITVDDLF